MKIAFEIRYAWARTKRWYDDFLNEVCRVIFKHTPRRFKCASIVYTNTKVWADKGNITPDAVTAFMMLEHFDYNK